jgi:hypothetical protein
MADSAGHPELARDRRQNVRPRCRFGARRVSQIVARRPQRVLRFWQIRHAMANEPSNPLVQSRFRPLRRPPPSSAHEPMRQTNATAVGVQIVLE